MSRTILQTLVGSRAHGLHNENSDYDYRGVFIEKTSDILSLNYKTRNTQWIEGSEDQTSYELSHFLSLACRSNPSILEVLVAPVKEITPEGEKLRALFPHVWNSKDVYNAFCGYSKNQEKKLLDDKDNRTNKYAVAYLRVLIMGHDLLTTGTMSLEVTNANIKEFLFAIKEDLIDKGTIINFAADIKQSVTKAYQENPDKQTNYDAVNEYLLTIRRENWS